MKKIYLGIGILVIVLMVFFMFKSGDMGTIGNVIAQPIDEGSVIKIPISQISRNAQWFDYNNDGRLDLIAGGENEEGERKIYIYENDEPQVAVKPDPPTNLKAVFVTNNEVVFSWEEGRDVDYEDTRVLTYILRVGQTPGGNDIYSGAIPVGSGNVGNKLSFKLNIQFKLNIHFKSIFF